MKKKLSKQNIRFSCFKGDIKKTTDINSWISENPNLRKIFHFAALVPIDKVDNNKIKAIKTNLIGTKNLINFIKRKKLKVWFFFPSICHVYKSKKSEIKETDNTEPISFYGNIKLKIENWKLFKQKYWSEYKNLYW